MAARNRVLIFVAAATSSRDIFRFSRSCLSLAPKASINLSCDNNIYRNDFAIRQFETRDHRTESHGLLAHTPVGIFSPSFHKDFMQAKQSSASVSIAFST